MGAAAASLAGAAAAQGASDMRIQLAQGSVEGVRESGVIAFLGVPYGMAGAARRFMPPGPPPVHTGVLIADAFGPAAPQRRAKEPTDEDCLFLNIWTPDLRDARRPVLVYIHGGGHVSGSGSDPLTHGGALAAYGDCVVVTLNHRLNVFGHLYLREFFGAPYAHSGNAALLDLIAALRWVKREIARFGGDPGSVTLFGQSGGGAKIATLMAVPSAQGLFHRVWTMSGQQVTAQGPRSASARARLALDSLGIAAGDVSALGATPTQRWLEALELKDTTGAGGLYFGPVLDEVTLPRHPFWPDAPPQSARIPMVLGNTSHETATLIANADPSVWTLTWETLPAKLGPAMVTDVRVETVIARYRALYPDAAPSDIFIRATTAGRSWRGQLIEAEARARQNAPTWVYQLDWTSPRDGGKWGAPHLLDIPLVFLTTSRAGDLTGDDPRARLAARRMADALLRFARTGDPGGGGARWPRYDERRRATMVFGEDMQIAFDPRGEERRLFGVAPYVQPGTF